MNTFELKTSIKFGGDALTYLRTLQDKKVFIVTDPFMVESHTIDKITKHLTEGTFTVFSNIVPDPPIELVVEGITKLKQVQPEYMIALGGGSAIDAAKAMMEFYKKIEKVDNICFIAIPTTSGTGSEVTSFSVITDKEKGTKYPLVADSLLPDVAVLDPELVKTVPASIVADTGMDVLTHAIEAYVSSKANDFSDALAQKAVELVFEYLVRSYKDKEDIEAKEKMHNASCLAGIAFNSVSLGLNHAIAHNIGGKLHIPHGRTNAILLPHIIAFNADIKGYDQKEYSTAAKKYAMLAKKVGLSAPNVRTGVRNLIDVIVRMQRQMNMPQRLTECKVTKEEVNKAKEHISMYALKDACLKTNPRTVTSGDILQILNKII